jgi:hypothetical protein
MATSREAELLKDALDAYESLVTKRAVPDPEPWVSNDDAYLRAEHAEELERAYPHRRGLHDLQP